MNEPTDSVESLTTTPRRPPRAFAAFESVPFRWLVGSLMTFFLAMQGQMLVRSIVAWQLTESELSLALVNLSIALPMVFGSFVAGAVIDRVERRKLVMISQILVLLNEITVLVLLLTGHLEYWHLLATSIVLGIIFPFIMPTRTAMIYPLVGRARLGNAMALQAASLNISRILGPAFIGLMIPLLSLPGAYACAVSLYIFSTLAMWKVPRSVPNPDLSKSILQGIHYSFTYVRQHREILLCLIFGLFPMLLALPIISFLVVFTEEVWQVGEVGLGLLTATVGIGGIVGSLTVAKLGDTVRRARLMMIAAMLFAAVLAAFCLSPFFWLALVLLLSANIFSNISQTLNQTIVQLLAHEEVRGRMSSLVMLSMGLTPLGVLPIALFSERFGIAVTMFTACIILLLIVTAFFLLSPSLRTLDQRLAEDSERELQGA